MRSRSTGFLVVAVASVMLTGFVAVLPSTAGAQQRKVVVVGDSVILGAQQPITSSFAARGWAVTFDAAVSRSTSAGLAAIESHRGELTDSLVVNLGANDAGNTASFRQKVGAIMNATASVPHVYWLTIREVRGYYAPANQVLRDMAAGRPNVTVIDWHAATLGATDLTAADGLHLNSAGANRMAQVVTDAVVAGVLASPPSVAPSPPPAQPAPPPPPDTAPSPTAPPETIPTTLPPETAPVVTETTAPPEVATAAPSRSVSMPRRPEHSAHDEFVLASAEPSQSAGRSGVMAVGFAAAAVTGLSLTAVLVAGLALAIVALVRSTADPPPMQSPTHPAVRARKRREHMVAAGIEGHRQES